MSPRHHTTHEGDRSMPGYRYTAVFKPAEEGGYTVTVPALPGTRDRRGRKSDVRVEQIAVGRPDEPSRQDVGHEVGRSGYPAGKRQRRARPHLMISRTA